MNDIDYVALSDEDKLDLLRLLYWDTKNNNVTNLKEKQDLIVSEAELVYDRLRKRSN